MEPKFVDVAKVDSAEGWSVGDWFTLRYLNHRRFRHRFWSDYPGSPDSQLVTADAFSVPLEGAFRVENLAKAWNVYHGVWYIAAKTQYGVWTNIQAGSTPWALRAAEPAPEAAAEQSAEPAPATSAAEQSAEPPAKIQRIAHQQSD